MNTRKARAAAHLLLVLGAVAVGVLVLGTPAGAAAPSVGAWWDVANAGGDAPAPPPPPDVKSGDLYVSGSNATATALSPPSSPPPVPALPPLPGPGVPSPAPALPSAHRPAGASHRALPADSGAGASSAQAIAGLEFDVPRGALVGSLTLQIDGSPPPQTSVVACQAMQNFTPESNGPWSDVPAYNCKRQAVATIKHGSLVFDQIGSLVRGTALAVVLVPGPLDRVVLKKPGAGALEVSKSAAPPPLRPPAGSSHGGYGGGHASNTGGGRLVPPAGGTGGGGVPGGFSAPAGPAAPSALPKPGALSQGVPAPAAPRSGSGGGAIPAPASASVPLSPLTTTNRRLIAAAVVAAEVIGFVLLQRGRRGPKPIAMPTLGGRLRPPDTAQAAETLPVERGVGRFARVREHAVPRL